MDKKSTLTGAELRQRRERLGLTQTELAERWGVPQATISRWESGRHEIRHAAILDDAVRYLEITEEVR